MRLLVAAVGATVAAMFELTVVPYVRVGDAHPHLVLVLGIVWVVAAGFESGLAWAFVGGLVLDVLAVRPLGASALALLVCMAGAAVAARALNPIRPLAPVPLTFAFSLVNSAMLFVLLSAVRSPVVVADPFGLLLPGAVYDTVLAAVLGPLAVSIHDKATEQERVEW